MTLPGCASCMRCVLCAAHPPLHCRPRVCAARGAAAVQPAELADAVAIRPPGQRDGTLLQLASRAAGGGVRLCFGQPTVGCAAQDLSRNGRGSYGCELCVGACSCDHVAGLVCQQRCLRSCARRLQLEVCTAHSLPHAPLRSVTDHTHSACPAEGQWRCDRAGPGGRLSAQLG
jgi:hypothetical protein